MSALMSLRGNNNSKFELLTFSGSSADSDNNAETLQFVPMPASSSPRKKMMKRRDRDLLRPATIIPLHTGHEGDGGCRRLQGRDCCKVAAVLLAAVLFLWLLLLTLHLRHGLADTRDALQTVEARSSELPARFHEAHVRLQLLQRNTSALWDAWQALHTNLTRQQAQVAGLQEQVASLQSSVQAAPQLSALPQDVKALQSSVAAFGSTLQDLQTGLRAVTAEHKAADQKIKDLQVTFNVLRNNTRMAPNNDGNLKTSIGDVVMSLVQSIAQLNTSVTALHNNVTSMGQKEDLQDFDVKARQLQMDARLANLSRELLHPAANDVTDLVIALTNNLTALVTSVRQDVNNLTLEVTALDTTSSEHSSRLRQLLQNVSVVKGVEKKLEGSQLQLASSVSDVKQQLQSLQHIISTLTSTTTSTTLVAPSEGGVASTAQASSGNARKRRAVVGSDQQDGHRPLIVEYRPINSIIGETRSERLEGNKKLRSELENMDDYTFPYELLNFDSDEQVDFESYNTPAVSPSSIVNDLGAEEDLSVRTEAEDENKPFMELTFKITESPRGL